MCCQIDLIRPGGATHPSPFEQKTLFWWLSKFPIKGKPCITSCAIHFVSRQTLFAAQWCSIIAVHVRPLSPLQCLETRTDEESRSILGEEPASQVFLPLHWLTSFSAANLEIFARQRLLSDCDRSCEMKQKLRTGQKAIKSIDKVLNELPGCQKKHLQTQ